MEDKAQTNQVQTASMNRTKAPQKVEVVVANSSSGSEVNILGELSIFVLRIGFCALMIHHGLEKLQDPQGFAEFVVGKYFPSSLFSLILWFFSFVPTLLSLKAAMFRTFRSILSKTSDQQYIVSSANTGFAWVPPFIPTINCAFSRPLKLNALTKDIMWPP